MHDLSRLPTSKQETSSHISESLNVVKESIGVLRDLKLPVEHWDVLMIHAVECKLLQQTRTDRVTSNENGGTNAFPEFANFEAFLGTRIRSLDLVEADKARAASARSQSNKNP
ncbi:hypothetical protein QAD02_007126 [Eretmocerus hayati]|uniref:Uncharacterized protein n=1 Tax=Eretmocerus hayati TaxID=131215 RepID=A0ACC2N562_9HYME|nr:hypothetical protein QAD02_007126 [Eretmocerus hayati]